MTDLISRADAIEVLQQFAEDEKPTDEMSKQFQQYQRGRHLAFLQAVEEIKALPSADAVSREEYEETDGVVKIKKQSAKEVGEIKHIIVCSPNYTRYFYNDSMPMQYKGGDSK